MDRANSLDDLPDAMGDDYGFVCFSLPGAAGYVGLTATMGLACSHGVDGSAADPNLLPRGTTVPVVSDVSPTSALVTWAPLGQAVSRILVQAALLDPKKMAAADAFKGALVTESVRTNADRADKTVVTGLSPDSFYVVRLLVTNPAGTVTCPNSALVATPPAGEPVPDAKKVAKAAKLFEKNEKEAAKAAAKEAEKAAKLTLKRQKEEEKATLKRAKSMKKQGGAAAAMAAAAAAPPASPAPGAKGKRAAAAIHAELG